MTDFPIYDHPPFLRLPQVAARYGCARSTIYAWMAEIGFPKPVKLGPRLVAWRLEDLVAWENGRNARRGAGPAHVASPRPDRRLA